MNKKQMNEIKSYVKRESNMLMGNLFGFITLMVLCLSGDPNTWLFYNYLGVFGGLFMFILCIFYNIIDDIKEVKK